MSKSERVPIPGLLDPIPVPGMGNCVHGFYFWVTKGGRQGSSNGNNR
jgi:hypothetical protein